MDIVEYISPFEYIGSSIGKINQNFTNLQQLPVTLSAKYIQIDSFITSIRSQLVTDTAIVSGNASVKDTFRAEGPIVLGSQARLDDTLLVWSWPVTLLNATETARALQFGSTNFANLYQSTALTLKTDSNFIVDLDTTFGNSAARTTTINSGNINLINATSNTQSLNFGSASQPKLYRGGNNLLDLEGSLETTQNVYVSGGLQAVNDVNTTRNLNVSGVAQIGGTLTQNLNVSAAAQFNTIRANIGSAGDTNNVVVRRATTSLETRTINSKVWDTGVTFADTGTGTANIVPKYTDADTIGNSNITDDGTTITLNGRLSLKSGIVAGTATLVSGTVTVTTAAAAAGSIVLVTLRTIGGTVTSTWQYRATPGAGNFTITAVTNTGATNTTDTSVLSWVLVNTVA